MPIRPSVDAPGDQPAYGLAEAARYVRVPVATLRSWALGRSYPKASGQGSFRPVIRVAQKQPPMLSFLNLTEAHVLRALRTDHAVSVKDVRKAIRYAEEELGVERLLLSKELSATGGELFLDHYGQLINLSASGQLAMRKVFELHIKRVVWGDRMPIRLYPFMSSDASSLAKPIVIDPRLAFGRPIVERRAISTHAIVERIDAGETVSDLAEDYDLTPQEIEEAVLYERAA